MLREKDEATDESVHKNSCCGAIRNVENKLYCLMHAPAKDSEEFTAALKRKIENKDYNFQGVIFPGEAYFSGHVFESDADFSWAEFCDTAYFVGTHFHQGAHFRGAKFGPRSALFLSAKFEGYTSFLETLFNGYVVFKEAEFNGGRITFGRALFNNEADFTKTVFSKGSVSFNKTKFRGNNVDFSEAQFTGGDCDFSKAEIKGADFISAQFNYKADFAEAEFSGGSANFTRAKFDEFANFQAAKFNCGTTLFNKAQFAGRGILFYTVTFQSVDFTEAQFSGLATNFQVTHFHESSSFRDAQFSGKFITFDSANFGDTAYFERAEFTGGDADFKLAQFNMARFDEAKFSGGHANFTGAKFQTEAIFEEAEFSGGNADFSKATFAGVQVSFLRAKFRFDAYFEKTEFDARTKFTQALFNQSAFFDETKFGPGVLADFRLARFMDLVRFTDLTIEDGAELYFGEATFEKPERVHFHSINNLQPRWFINIDTRKFNFENVTFSSRRRRKVAVDQLSATQTMLERLTGVKIEEQERPNKLLSIACRRLAENAEENNRYNEAMNLRYMAMDSYRREGIWWRFMPVSLHWWYWASSGYGERWRRALVILFLIWLIPFAFYASPLSRFERKVSEHQLVLSLIVGLENPAAKPDLTDIKGLEPMHAAFYSLNTMAFQKPEPKPAEESWLTRLVVILQTILGPLQAALLALAIRRKFMR